MRLLLLGAGGQVGLAIQRAFSTEGSVIPVTRSDLDFTLDDSAFKQILLGFLVEHTPDYVVNAAAYTDVAGAETNKSEAFLVNSDKVDLLCSVLEQYNRWRGKSSTARLIHFSTDYVFGEHSLQTSPPIPETYKVFNPLNIYGKSKLSGEGKVRNWACSPFCLQATIFRLSAVYSWEGKNILLSLVRQAKDREELTFVDNIFTVPTSADAVAFAVKQYLWSLSYVVKEPSYNLYNLACSYSPGYPPSWADFAEQACNELGLKVKINRVPKKIWEAVASNKYPKRAQFSVLSNVKFQESFGYAFVHWKTALTEACKKIDLDSF